jgi:hypothetical protein
LIETRVRCGPRCSSRSSPELDADRDCAACHTKIAAAIAVVRGGVFEEVRALDDAEVNRIVGASRGKADSVIVRDDGSYWPCEDWYDKTIVYRPDINPQSRTSRSTGTTSG